MNEVARIIITIIFAALCSAIAVKLKIPAGVLLASIFAAAFLHTFNFISYFPSEMKIVGTAMVGIYIGCRVNKNDIPILKKIIRPAIVMTIFMLMYNIICSFIISNFTNIDFPSAMLSFAPGGVSDMSLVALDMGINPIIVSTIQTLRLLTVVACTPFLAQAFLKFMKKKGYAINKLYEDSLFIQETKAKTESSNNQSTSIIKKSINILITLLVGLSSGILGKLSGFPAGNLCFPVLVIMILNFRTSVAYMPLVLRRSAQMLGGIIIGMKFSVNDFIMIKESFILIILILAGWIILNLILAIIVHKWTNISLITTIFSTSAGGITDLGIIASEMGGNVIIITAFQMTRLLSVLIFYPIIVKLFF